MESECPVCASALHITDVKGRSAHHFSLGTLGYIARCPTCAYDGPVRATRSDAVVALRLCIVKEIHLDGRREGSEEAGLEGHGG